MFRTFWYIQRKLVHMKTCPHLSPLSLSLLPKPLPQAAHQRDALHLSLLPSLLLLPYTNHIQEPHNLLPLALGSLHHRWYFTENFGSSFDTKEKASHKFSLSHNLAADSYSHASATVDIQSYKFLKIQLKFLLLCWWHDILGTLI